VSSTGSYFGVGKPVTEEEGVSIKAIYEGPILRVASTMPGFGQEKAESRRQSLSRKGRCGGVAGVLMARF
jgi:hypothetical protein